MNRCSAFPTTPVTFVGVDSITQNLCGVSQNETCNLTTLSEETGAGFSGMSEVALDLDMVGSLAPSLSQILVYEGPNSNQGIIDIYNRIAVDGAAEVVSTSWGAPEAQVGGSNLQVEAQIFQRMAAQGPDGLCGVGG